MKILMLSDFFLSGQTTHVLDLATQLKRIGVDLHISFGTIHSKLFWTHYAPMLRRNKIAFSEGVTPPSRFRPDLVHAQSSTLFKHAKKLGARLGVPHILTCHGLGFNHPRYHSVLAGADALIAIGPRVAQELKQFSAKVVIISNGIDTDVFCPPQTNDPRKDIVYIGRMEERRIPALRELARAHKAMSPNPLPIISDLNPELSNTTFIPWQVDLLPHLQKYGITVACGRTAREALSCGNAVILMQQKYDGIITPELVTESDFDFSGNLGRFPYAHLQSDLRRLLRRSNRLKKLQAWGRSYAVANLSSELMAERTLMLYQEVLILAQPLAKGSLWPPL